MSYAVPFRDLLVLELINIPIKLEAFLEYFSVGINIGHICFTLNFFMDEFRGDYILN
jgi:hypothetical protein